MKAYLFAVVVVLSLFSLAGCANQSSTAASSDADATRRTYSQDDLRKTGRTQTGEALQAADPSIGLSGSGR
jgi:predicted small lipoprotein YifL